MDELTILKAEHEIITDSYGWITDENENPEGRIQYMLGIHDFAGFLIDRLEERKE